MNIKPLLFSFFFITYFSNVNAQQAPDIQWQKVLGGGGVDQAREIKQCMDGGYVVIGLTTSIDGDITEAFGGYDYWLAKTNSTGVIEWQKSFGGTLHDWGSSVEQTADSGFVVAGYTISNNGHVTNNHGDFDYWVLKLDADGNIQWQKTFGGTGIDHARSVQQTTDGGYIVVGSTWSSNGDVVDNHGSDDYWVVKLDSNGVIEWKKTYGGQNSDLCYVVRQTADGGYILGGATNSTDGDVSGNHGDYDYWLVKISGVGVIEWKKTYGGTGDDKAYSIEQTVDGGYIVAGFTGSSNGDVTSFRGAYDYWVLKLNSSGTIEWQKTLGGTGVDNAYSIKQTQDGGYIVAGFSNSNNENITNPKGGYDYWVVKLGQAGDVHWQKSMGGSAIDQISTLAVTTDGGCIVAGYSTSYDGDLYSSGNQGNGDYWLVKLSPSFSGIQEQSDALKISIFPNPTGEQITLETTETIKSISIYDNWGKLIRTEYTTSFSVSNLSAGNYSLRIITGKGMKTLNFIKK